MYVKAMQLAKALSIAWHDSLAERSKAVAQGAIPQGRGFEPHSCHFVLSGLDFRALAETKQLNLGLVSICGDGALGTFGLLFACLG